MSCYPAEPSSQGEFYGESAPAEHGCYGLRRLLPAVRVRESMIVPVTAHGRDQARVWRELYNDEENWLDWALDRAGLPRREQIFSRCARRSGRPRMWAVSRRLASAGSGAKR